MREGRHRDCGFDVSLYLTEAISTPGQYVRDNRNTRDPYGQRRRARGMGARPGGREHGQGDGSTGGTLHMDPFTFLHLTVFRHVHILLLKI